VNYDIHFQWDNRDNKELKYDNYKYFKMSRSVMESFCNGIENLKLIFSVLHYQTKYYVNSLKSQIIKGYIYIYTFYSNPDCVFLYSVLYLVYVFFKNTSQCNLTLIIHHVLISYDA